MNIREQKIGQEWQIMPISTDWQGLPGLVVLYFKENSESEYTGSSGKHAMWDNGYCHGQRMQKGQHGWHVFSIQKTHNLESVI